MKIITIICGLILLTAFSQEINVEERKNEEQPDSLISLDFNPIEEIDSNEYFTIIDTNYSKYKLPIDFEKPKKWKNKREERERYSAEYSDSLNILNILSMIDSSNQFWDVCKAKSWCLKNYQSAFPYLIARLSIKEKVGLENTADLIIGCRMNTGDLEFYGHGGIIKEDLFTVAGRVSWILNELTGEEFVSVQCGMTKEDSEEYKALWIKYIKN